MFEVIIDVFEHDVLDEFSLIVLRVEEILNIHSFIPEFAQRFMLL